MHHRAVLSACAALLCVSLVLPAAAGDEPTLEERLAAVARRAVADDGVPGLSVAVALGRDLLLAEGYGYSDPARREPAKAGSAYRAGSLTAPLVAVALLQLAESGELDLDSSLSKYLDLEGEPGAVTLAQCLAHSSGISSYAGLAAPGGEAGTRAQNVLAWIRERPLEFRPGQCVSYSSSNALVAGLVLEKVAGAPVREVLERRVFGKLDLEATRYSDDGPTLHELADATQELAGSLEEDDRDWQPFDAARLCTSASDLVRIQRALSERELLGERGLARLREPFRLNDGAETSVAAATSLTPLAGYACVAYGGGLGGARAHVAWYPDADLVIAVLASSDDAPVDRIERRLARIVLGVAEPGVVDLELAPEALARYAGGYYIGCSRYLVRIESGALVVAPPEGVEYALRYQGEHVFVSQADDEVRLVFRVEGDRPASEFVLEEHGAQSVARRVE